LLRHAVGWHTGTLTGSDDVLDAAFRRIAVLRVDTISNLFDMAEVLSKQPRPRGPRLAIVTNAGGPGVLATDMLVGEGGEVANLSQETFQKLDAILPAHWSRNNPVDVLGDAKPDRFTKAVEIVSKDDNNNGVLVIVTPQAMIDATAVAKELQVFNKIPGEPILASWTDADEVAAGSAVLNEYELILGSSIEPQFGPILLFGAGGQLVEVMHDYVLGLPLKTTPWLDG
jgi:acetyltransferase